MAEEDKDQFFDVAERLVNELDPAEQERLKEELARLTFGGADVSSA
jgi:hypothetical protein